MSAPDAMIAISARERRTFGHSYFRRCEKTGLSLMGFDLFSCVNLLSKRATSVSPAGHESREIDSQQSGGLTAAPCGIVVVAGCGLDETMA